MIGRTLPAYAVLAACLAAPRGPAFATPGSEETTSPELSVPAVEECVSAHDSAALLRLEDRWLDARAAMQRCADEACPITIRSDCRAWLEELAAALPTVLVVVERDDDGRRPVQLDLDGRLLELPEKPGPIEVLPGPHRLRFTLEGYPAVEADVTLQKGEKNHVVQARFLRPRPAAPPPRPWVPPPPRQTRPVPLATYLYGAGSLVLFAGSGVLLGSALDAKAKAQDGCAPGCPKAERESIDRRLLLADLVGLGGLGLGGLAVYSYVRRPWVTETGGLTRVELRVAEGRAELKLGGSF